MPLSLSLLLLSSTTTVGDGFFEQEGACVCLSLSVFRLQGRSRRGGVLSFFAAGACAGAVLFFCLFLLICLNSDPSWEEELRGLFCLSVCLSVGDE